MLISSTELLLRIPVIDFTNRFVFHRTCAVDIQSIFEFLNSFVILWPVVSLLDRLSIYFSLFLRELCVCVRMVSTLCFSPIAEDSRAGSIPVQSSPL